jgi:hypothetical protein
MIARASLLFVGGMRAALNPAKLVYLPDALQDYSPWWLLSGIPQWPKVKREVYKPLQVD